MKILLLGKNGQVGRELSTRLGALGELVVLDRAACDLSSPGSIPGIIDNYRPDIIINAAAYTAVDRAEEEESLAMTINAEAVAILAEQAKKYDALLVQYSTDYVFDGSKPVAYLEDDTPCPINVYGRSKLAGEQAIREQDGRYIIFRTSWVYASHGTNFIRTMLRLASERESLSVIDDQIGAPTSAELIADVTVDVLQKLLASDGGMDIQACYHLAASGETSWYGYAKLVIIEALEQGVRLKATPEKIAGIRSSEYEVAARRPLNSRLDTSKLTADFDISLPSWEKQVIRTVHEIVTTGCYG